jgi:TRAP-type uncharacterized transport system substrate-binding protein
MHASLLGLCSLATILVLSPLNAGAQIPLFDASVKADPAPQPRRPSPRALKPENRPAKEAKSATDKPVVTEEEQAKAAQHNAWTIGLAGGQPEGSFHRYAADLAKVLDDGENLRVLPIMSYGAVGNITDLLYLNGVDVVLTYADVLDHFKNVEKVPNLERRLNYIIPMFQGELHLLVRSDIKSIQDLAGRKVAFDTLGSGANYTGGIVFERLGVKVEKVYLNNALALEAMHSGELAGLVHTGARPSELFATLKPETGFHFLPVEYSDKFRDYYAPGELTRADYPNLIAQDRIVRTISVQAVLAVYNWPPETDRHRRAVRFVEHLFDRFDRLRAAPFQPGWREMNLAGTLPGWARFPPAQDLLDRTTRQSSLNAPIDPAVARAKAIRAAPSNPAEQERLFHEFMQWTRQQKR